VERLTGIWGGTWRYSAAISTTLSLLDPVAAALPQQAVELLTDEMFC